MHKPVFLSFFLGSLLLALGGCGNDAENLDQLLGTGGTGGGGGDGGSRGFEPAAFGEWLKFEPEGALCSNGSQYKFFVQFSETSDDVIVFFEGGGACWDFESCSRTAGIRGAANPDGLPDSHATENQDFGDAAIDAKFVYPLLNDDPDVSPMADWNKVFVPYCTGDVYSGQTTTTYSDPNEMEPDNEFLHFGHTNVLAMIDELNGMFNSIPRLFVSGCSAGGAGSIINYHFLRSGLNEVGRGYLLNDSGPIYPNSEPTSRSLPVHSRIRSVWNVDPLIMSAPRADDIFDDFGNISEVLAAEYPNDRIAATFFQLDYNYSLYSYERFYDNDSGTLMPIEFGSAPGLDEFAWLDRADFYSLWADDIALMRAQYDTADNLAYYLPFYRDTNSSHCVTVPGIEDVPTPVVLDAINYIGSDGEMGAFAPLAWAGSDMETDAGTMNLRDFVEHLLDDSTPLESHFEDTPEGHYMACAPGMDDEPGCRDAVCERLGTRQEEQGCPEM